MEAAFDLRWTNWVTEKEMKVVGDVEFPFSEASIMQGEAEAERRVEIENLHFDEFVLALELEMVWIALR